ncbi:unnamed protein product [Soboliphyme baturini]|uniref:Endo/exonuclease/phosphatase domain-containing protein n=1 Tax=Soboliphyme baturini TaxID=241478 RepID=A0A183IDS0_9BILA|nr:unnamed protein product [Soboliphyme baturini]
MADCSIRPMSSAYSFPSTQFWNSVHYRPSIGNRFVTDNYLQANNFSIVPSRSYPSQFFRSWVDKSRQVSECKNANKIGQWETVTPSCQLPHSTVPCITFTFCSYNVLCQSTLDSMYDLYPDCKPEHLTWSFRWPLLQKMFESLDADIFCLQEIEAQYVEPCYMAYFKGRGFDGTFKKRTNDKADGCAIFWRRSKFSLHSSTQLEYLLPRTAMNRDNVGLIVTLKSADDKNDGTKQGLITVATTHLLYNLKRGDIKLAQMALLLSRVQKAAQKNDPETHLPTFHPVIICGDFNATPFSPLHKFVADGALPYEGLRRNEISGQGALGGPKLCFPLLPPSANILEEMCDLLEESSTQSVRVFFRKRFFPAVVGHRLTLRSVYDSEKTTPCRHVTSVLGLKTVDHIFYSDTIQTGTSSGTFEKPFLLCTERCPLPMVSELKMMAAPNSWMPSDHFPLLSKFNFYT